MSTTDRSGDAGAGPGPHRRHRLDYVDGIRGLAASYVVVSHAWNTVFGHRDLTNPVQLATVWMAGGHYAVTVFIVVSGFSLGLTYWRHDRQWPGGVPDFLRRRARRLLPPYWTAVVVCSTVALTVLATPQGSLWDGATGIRPSGVVTHLLAVQDIYWAGPAGSTAFWSLAVELHIYLAFALALIVMHRVRLPWVPLYLVAVAATGVARLTHSPLYSYPLSLYAVFVLGLVAAQFAVLDPDGADAARPRWSRRVRLCLLAGVILSLACLPTFSFDSTATDFVVGPLTAMVLVGLTAGRPAWLLAITSSRTCTWLGHSSYSMYLIHPMILELAWRGIVRPPHLPEPARLAAEIGVGLTASVLAGRIFYRLVERPFMSRRTRPDDAVSIRHGMRARPETNAAIDG